MEVAKVKNLISATATDAGFLTIYNPRELTDRYRGVQTVSQALSIKSESIGGLNRTFGSQKVEALIKLQLVYLNDLLNLKRPLNEVQIDEIALEIVSVYVHLTMADIHLIMRRARTGHYGEFYESLNMPKVLRWFFDYFEERCEVAARRSLDSHCQVKEWNDTSRISSDAREREAFARARTEYLAEKEKIVKPAKGAKSAKRSKK